MQTIKTLSIIFAISFVALIVFSPIPASAADTGTYHKTWGPYTWDYFINPAYRNNPFTWIQNNWISQATGGGTVIPVTQSNGLIAINNAFQPFAMLGNTIKISNVVIKPNFNTNQFLEDKSYNFELAYTVTFLDYKDNIYHTSAHIKLYVSSTLNGDWETDTHYVKAWKQAYTFNIFSDEKFYAAGGEWQPSKAITSTFHKEFVYGGQDTVHFVFKGIYPLYAQEFTIATADYPLNVVKQHCPPPPVEDTNVDTNKAPNYPAGYTTNPLVTCYQCSKEGPVSRVFYDTTTCPSGWQNTPPDCTGMISFDLLGQSVSINPWYLVAIIVAVIAIVIFLLWRQRGFPSLKIPKTPRSAEKPWKEPSISEPRRRTPSSDISQSVRIPGEYNYRLETDTTPAEIMTHDKDAAAALGRAGFHERVINRVKGDSLIGNDMSFTPKSVTHKQRVWANAYQEVKKLPVKGSPITDVPAWEELDPLVRPVLNELWRKGYDTNYSCEGHIKGESTQRPRYIWNKNRNKKLFRTPLKRKQNKTKKSVKLFTNYRVRPKHKKYVKVWAVRKKTKPIGAHITLWSTPKQLKPVKRRKRKYAKKK